MLYLFYLSAAAEEGLKLLRVPKMLQLGDLLREGGKSSPAFLHKGNITVADHLFDGQRRHETSRPASHKIAPHMVEITIPLLMIELSMFIGPLDAINSVS